MYTFSLDLTQFHRRVEESSSAIRKDVESAVNKAIVFAATKAKEGGWKDRTGNLRLSIVSKPIGWKGQTYWGQYNTGVPYAAYVEYDTSPHLILPLASYAWQGQKRRPMGPGTESVVGRGYALRWKDDGGEHFARSVWHPGTAGFHYMLHAGDATRYYLINILHGNFPNLRSVWTH